MGIRCLSNVETLSKQSIMIATRKPRKQSLDEMWSPGWEAGLEKRTFIRANNNSWVYPCCFKDLFVLDVLRLDHNLLVFFSSLFSFSLISGFPPLKAPCHRSTSPFLLPRYRSTLNTRLGLFHPSLGFFSSFYSIHFCATFCVFFQTSLPA